jgi:hypothetical protein
MGLLLLLVLVLLIVVVVGEDGVVGLVKGRITAIIEGK